jgi:hypothetical protein
MNITEICQLERITANIRIMLSWPLVMNEGVTVYNCLDVKNIDMIQNLNG